MKEIHQLKRYEIRGAIVYDKQEKRPVTLEEIEAALEFWAFTRAAISTVRREDF